MPERLQKILARHGLGSRREIERWIAEGRITVNLLPAKVGDQFHPGDRVAIDGKEVTARLSIEVAPQVLLYHKAQGQPIVRDDRTKRPPGEDGSDADVEDMSADSSDTVVDKLPAIRGSRWVPINPMHAGDSGLLLLTNDGNLSYALTRRKRWIPTAYMVRVLAPSDAKSGEHKSGEHRAPPEIPLHVSYDNGRGMQTIDFDSVAPAGGEGSNLWYRVGLARADQRAAVRALFESRDLKVSRMTQVAFGNIELPRDLPRGRHRALSIDQVASIYALAQIDAPGPPPTSVDRVDPRRRRAIAPDRRRSSKKKLSAREVGAKKFDVVDSEKRPAKKTAPKKESTWRVGGRKNRGSSGRRR
jgi:23S rRNA pseudouridine2605 synthase